jgi:hypothetical protein
MPLTTTATWPSLANRTASAADVNAKFEWLEGHRYPHNAGALTTGAYDIGSSSYGWESGYFVSAVIGGGTMPADINPRIKVWGSFDVSGGTLTTLESYKVASVQYSSALPGMYTISVNDWGYTSTSFQYCAVCATTRNTNMILAGRGTFAGIGIHQFQVQTRSMSDVLTDSSFNFIGIAYLP